MKLLFTISFLFVFFLMGTGQNTENVDVNHPNVHKIVVKEVLQTTSYTYLQAEENGQLQWLAMPKMEASIGETYYHQNGMEMVDFKSKELNRTFSSVLFLNGVIDPEIVEGGDPSVTPSPQKSKTEVEILNVDIEPATGGITIAELFSNKEKYANNVVKIRGKVTKFNSKIMSRNWIHMQDGTSNSGEFDFTATTADEVKVGDVITIEGIIALDKDFGAGYFYKVIMENGKVIE
ncbi:MAG: hypothetical protein K8R74_10610 [Bacteroidales bacterium]|nr:hypothetical protein [Bacteroidales bacterium]